MKKRYGSYEADMGEVLVILSGFLRDKKVTCAAMHRLLAAVQCILIMNY